MKKDTEKREELMSQIFVLKPDIDQSKMKNWTIQHLEQYLDKCRKDFFTGLKSNS